MYYFWLQQHSLVTFIFVCEFLIIHVRWVIFTVNSNVVFFHLISPYWILFHCSLSSSQYLAYFLFQQTFLYILSHGLPLPLVTFWKGLYLSRQFHLSFDLFFDGYAFTSGSKPSTEVFIQSQSVGAWLWLLVKALTSNFLELMGYVEFRGVGCFTARLSKVCQDGYWQFPNFEVIPLETWTHSICSCQPLLETWFSPVGTVRWNVCLAPVLDLSAHAVAQWEQRAPDTSWWSRGASSLSSSFCVLAEVFWRAKNMNKECRSWCRKVNWKVCKPKWYEYQL